MQRYTWPTGTVGGDICVREFRDKVKWMRRFRSERVYAIVTLGDKFMPTRWGGRQRPELLIKRWVLLGPDGTALPAPSAASPALPPTVSAVSSANAGVTSPTIAPKGSEKTLVVKSGVRIVEEPSLSEQTGGDSVPW
jgi:hypothetical protein